MRFVVFKEAWPSKTVFTWNFNAFFIKCSHKDQSLKLLKKENKSLLFSLNYKNEEQ